MFSLGFLEIQMQLYGESYPCLWSYLSYLEIWKNTLNAQQWLILFSSGDIGKTQPLCPSIFSSGKMGAVGHHSQAVGTETDYGWAPRGARGVGSALRLHTQGSWRQEVAIRAEGWITKLCAGGISWESCLSPEGTADTGQKATPWNVLPSIIQQNQPAA